MRPTVLAAFVLALPSAALAADAEKGKSTYQRNCLACHGATGGGDGPAARALRPAPPSFADAKYWADRTDEQVVAAIKTGRPGTSMMGFGSLTDEQLADLTAYLRTLSTTK